MWRARHKKDEVETRFFFKLRLKMLRAIRGNKKRETTEISFNDSVKTEPTGQNLNSRLTRKRQAIAIGSGPD